jgi:hypothetical protein
VAARPVCAAASQSISNRRAFRRGGSLTNGAIGAVAGNKRSWDAFSYVLNHKEYIMTITMDDIVGINRQYRDFDAHLAQRANAADQQRKVLRYEILRCATPTQFRQIWDQCLVGGNFDSLVDELGQIQAEYGRRKI